MAAIDQVDPLVSFRFGVEIEGVVVGWFTECSQFNIERAVKPQPEGGVNNYVHQLPGRVKAANITLKRGLAGQELWNWLQEGAYDGKVTRRNVSIIIFNSDLSEAKRWNLTKTYPVKWSSADFNSGGNEISLETLELVQDAGPSSATGGGALQRASTASDAASSGSTTQEIDLPGLAQKVYALLKQELRVERDRLGRSSLG